MSRAEDIASGGDGPASVNTIIVGNGPSALLLSYILHGHIPIYDSSHPHPDPLLHAKLKDTVDLLRLDVEYITEHFGASRFSYSTQALPINVLLDTLIRPNGDTESEEQKTCVRWEYRPEKAVSHLVLGNTAKPGGQWEDNPVGASWDIGTLSYGPMLSLPGYSFGEYFREINGYALPPYTRPSRRQVAGYFSTYPYKVGIEERIRCQETLQGVSRTSDGFHVRSHNMFCRSLVLATGIFSNLIAPRPLLQPLLHLPKHLGREAPPLLVIGSGFTAADMIISTPPEQKIIHIFKWAPETRPSPLRACHQHAYPEYAGVYRVMRLSATGSGAKGASRPKAQRGSSTAFLESRDWESVYEGLPNTAIVNVDVRQNMAIITLESDDGHRFCREVGDLAYAVGRRGSLNYLDEALQKEVVGVSGSEIGRMISGQTLREKAWESTKVAPNVYITGSLTGDSLVRFAYGGCTFAAGRIMCLVASLDAHGGGCSKTKEVMTPTTKTTPAMNGMVGHNDVAKYAQEHESQLDRRKDNDRHDDKLDLAIAEGKEWRDSGWWGGGIVVSSSALYDTY